MSQIQNFLKFPLKTLLTELRISAGALSGVIQTRNTFILKRRWDPHLSKVGGKTRKLQAKNYVYDLVEDTSCTKQPNLKVIMTDDVEGIGSKGQVVDVRPFIGRHLLLAAKKAVYASPENLKRLEEDMVKGIVRLAPKHSSPWAPKTARELSKFILYVHMNLEEPWTLEPWHLRVAFRTACFIVPEDVITMPRHPISGPDINLDNKEFSVKVTINSMEEVFVRCRLHHWTNNPDKAVPRLPNEWQYQAEPLFPEEAEHLDKLPKPDGMLSQRPTPI